MNKIKTIMSAAFLAAAVALSGCSLLGNGKDTSSTIPVQPQSVSGTENNSSQNSQTPINKEQETAGSKNTQAGSSQTDSVQRDTGQADPAQTDSGQTDPAQTDPAQAGSAHAGVLPSAEENDPDSSAQDDSSAHAKALQMLAEMSLEEKVGQMFLVNPEMIDMYTDGTVVSSNGSIAENIQKFHLGGIILFEGNILDREQTETMIADFQAAGEIPLFIGVDEEGGIVSRIGRNPAMGCTWFPNMREIGDTGDPSKAYEVGDTIGREIHDLGFNLDFAPDADVVTNPENTVIGDRAFSSDPAAAAQMVPQVIYGLQNNGVASSIKHFPGHGNTSTDSHTGFSSTDQDLDGLRQVEFLPFKAGIEAGTDMVMVSHIAAPAAVGTDEPASLSYEMITGLLRDELQFDGVVITDSLQMGAITEYYTPSAAVLASLNAGADIFLMPASLGESYNAVIDAVQNGSVSQERIDESVTRILEVKINRHIL